MTAVQHPAPAAPDDTAPNDTAGRLLEAAEELIAARGVDGVSVRAVNTAAGANVAAVHYHFGSKEALVDAVLTRRMGELTARRIALLDALVDEPRPGVRGVVAALVVPIAEFASEPRGRGRTYVRFLAALDAAGHAWRQRMGEAFAPQYEHVVRELERALPDVPPAVVSFRLGLVSTALLSTLADPDHAGRHWRAHGLDLSFDGVVEALIDHITGALAAPVSPRTIGGTP
jgi:AcrR family transcriptional regulator